MPNISQSLKDTGLEVAKIPVSISYRIIDLFSAGLYSSPNKAIEELVVNSYDAMAANVLVVVPSNLSAVDGVIWVVDDGTSMDEAGLLELWQIAKSYKRDPKRQNAERPPIGRFGIGKLATYVLAVQLTHITKTAGNVYRAVTMDFSIIDPEKTTESNLELPVRTLTEAEAREMLTPLLGQMGQAAEAIKLFGADAAPTWTVAAISRFKPFVSHLQLGRLRWVLATALPASPQFALFLNGTRVESAKSKRKPLRAWVIGQDDAVAAKHQLSRKSEPGRPPTVEIADIGEVYGQTEIYEDPLTEGKSADVGRSHGIFVVVRGRVVNLQDALFGIAPLSHGPFSRFRMVVHADGLDDILRATREAVLETTGVLALREYIQAKFNEARVFYSEWVDEKEKKSRPANRVSATPQSLSRRPLVSAIRRVIEGDLSGLTLTNVPRYAKAAEGQAFLESLEAALVSEQGLIKEIKLAIIGVDQPLAKFHADSGVVYVNALHPFYSNFSDYFHNTEPFNLIAVAEVLTEAYLFEENIGADVVRSVMHRRDQFLRELVYSQRLSAPLVAELLKDSVSDKVQLEVAVASALSNMGFETSRISGSGEPDGIAVAAMGVRSAASTTRADFKILYDAKSSGKPRVKAKDLNISGVLRHREKYAAQYSLIVAPGFEGEDDEQSAANVDARREKVTLTTVKDLVDLVYVAATYRLGFSTLRELFETCFTASEVRAWIGKAQERQPAEYPIQEVLDAVWSLQGDPDTLHEPVTFAHLKMASPSMKKRFHTTADLRDFIVGLTRFVPQFIRIDGDQVALDAPPERIVRELRAQGQKVPVEYRDTGVLQQLGEGDNAIGEDE